MSELSPRRVHHNLLKAKILETLEKSDTPLTNGELYTAIGVCSQTTCTIALELSFEGKINAVRTRRNWVYSKKLKGDRDV